MLLTIRPHLTPLDIPYGDGNWYISRAILLHGVLHDGQWQKFWELLNAPLTATLLPTCVLYWLIPTPWASPMTYGIVHTVAWHLLLMLGAWGLLREVGQSRLLPAIMMLSLASNNILDYTLYYYIDMSFAACALVALWLLVRAFRVRTKCSIVLAGIATGLLFFVKPGNTVVFLGCYGVAAATMLGIQSIMKPRDAGGAWFRGLIWGSSLWFAGFVPVLMLACCWTVIPHVVVRILASSSDFWAPEPMANPLLRLFYFPLCLSYYYSFALLAVCGVMVGLLARWSPMLGDEQQSPVVAGHKHPIIGLSVGFIVAWGLGFSFLMGFKIIRSLPLMLPILWITLFSWMAMRWRVTRTLTLFAAIYFGIAHAQFAWGVLGVKQNRGTEDYVLRGDWLNRLPAQVTSLEQPAAITKSLLSAMHNLGVTQGRVAVGTEMLYWNSGALNWLSQTPYFLRGEVPALEFATAVDHQGKPIVGYLSGATAFMLMVHPGIQYSREVFDFNVRTAQYAERKWKGSIARRIEILSMGDGKPAVVIIVFNNPLTESDLSAYLNENFPGRRSEFIERENKLLQSRLSIGEYWNMVKESRKQRKR